MTLPERIAAFISLGDTLKNLTPDEKQELAYRAANDNPWFDAQNVANALNGIIYLLDKQNLEDWLFVYDLKDISPKKIGVVMAGNIPMVGFHDFLSVLLAGHILYAKLSSSDKILIKTITQKLISIEPRFTDYIHFVDILKDVDAIIATGSDNTARYFEYYFAKKPHIIRRNRSSVGVLTGKETSEELHALGQDIFYYYGLGCRNVSKVLVPEGYNFIPFFEAIEPYNYIASHHKYHNNYDYNKSILLVNQTKHLDNGFLLVTESTQLVSPISVLFYETYQDLTDLNSKLAAIKDKLQCLVSAGGLLEKSLPFGEAQFPAVWDYADGVDTLEFLAQV